MTDEWWQVRVTCRPQDTDAVAVALVEATGQGVEEIEPGLLSSVMTSREDAARLIAALAEPFPGLTGTTTRLDTVDWSTRWRDGIITHAFGRVVLTPSWLPVTPEDNHVVVTIDPESAFGSGEHGSTRGALTLLERHLVPGQEVLDLGSGSGILAIAAAKLGALSAIGIEVDDEAMPIAEANAIKNGVSHVVTFLLGDAGELAVLAGPADVICSNILRTVNVLLLPSIERALRTDGIVIFAGMEDSEKELFLPVLSRNGFTAVDEVRDSGWWSVAARRT